MLNKCASTIFGLLALCVILALAGCKPQTIGGVTSDPSKATYSYDRRTGLCFATFGVRLMDSAARFTESYSVSAVPCNEAVLALVPTEQQ